MCVCTNLRVALVGGGGYKCGRRWRRGSTTYVINRGVLLRDWLGRSRHVPWPCAVQVQNSQLQWRGFRNKIIDSTRQLTDSSSYNRSLLKLVLGVYFATACRIKAVFLLVFACRGTSLHTKQNTVIDQIACSFLLPKTLYKGLRESHVIFFIKYYQLRTEHSKSVNGLIYDFSRSDFDSHRRLFGFYSIILLRKAIIIYAVQ